LLIFWKKGLRKEKKRKKNIFEALKKLSISILITKIYRSLPHLDVKIFKNKAMNTKRNIIRFHEISEHCVQ